MRQMRRLRMLFISFRRAFADHMYYKITLASSVARRPSSVDNSILILRINSYMKFEFQIRNMKNDSRRVD